MPHIRRRVRSRKSGFGFGIGVDSDGRERAVRREVVLSVRCWQKRQILDGNLAVEVLECSSRRGRADKRRMVTLLCGGRWYIDVFKSSIEQERAHDSQKIEACAFQRCIT